MPNVKNDSVYISDSDIYGKKIKPIPKPEKEIGIDTDQDFFQNIVAAGENSILDLTKFNDFLTISQNRNNIYDMLDTMSEDSTISQVLDTYAEYVTEMNSNGEIVWADSPEPEVAKFVNFLLDSINVDKHIYKWAHSLCKYGDLYLRLYHESEYDDNLLTKQVKHLHEHQSLNESTLAEVMDLDPEKEKEELNEDVIVKLYKTNDRYVHYLEMVPNPAEMFELTRFGKTYSYVQAPVNTMTKVDGITTNYFKYQFNRGDVNIFDATNFVHAVLQDNSPRTPETVEIFSDSDDASAPITYTVNKGQSVLQDIFKIWREMMLLENAMMLNRLTRSSIVRVIQVEVADMPKEKVGPHLIKIKQLMEQKTSINDGQNMSEYTNPGPMENNVYVPTRNGVGALTMQAIGGDVNVSGLADIEYFRDKMFGALGLPKQYFGFTGDGAGFNGGQSLTIISTKFAKTVLRIQNALIQALTDAINIMLIDKGLSSYINKFKLHMLVPMTQSQLDRNDSVDKQLQQVSDIMSLLEPIEDPATRLNLIKNMISGIVNNAEVISIIQEYIDNLEKEKEEANVGSDVSEDDSDIDINIGGDIDRPSRSSRPDFGSSIESDTFNDTIDDTISNTEETSQTPENSFETVLPTPAELNIGDVGDSNNPNL